ncbi:cation:proton antiporter [Thiopseudomonas alkaliphila]|uniref:monovalent cation/H+ antiporter subunit D n=1 Tax=Thiopseudomonas alkaliphila TaxID=1697053 RepID=UPI00069E030F|nr:monovalent cation/H+ antiporter subunit D [Thiopseudomonas alkaliphila]AKX44338.1 cation:proton antiporter [Thiopseudomonas alkaliphila]
MMHTLVVPVILPLFTGAALMLLGRLQQRTAQLISLLATLAMLPVAIYLLIQAASGEIQYYALGNWSAPFGIILLLDRLSAVMVLLTAVLAAITLLYALRGDDQKGEYFHPLFQFQLAGIYGAFLTGDLFNLFVFFEILLIASYALLLHGRSKEQVQSATHYVILNLIGSSLFLIAAGVFYGIAGTLNMVDLAQAVAVAEGDKRYLLNAAGLLLFIVFGLKAAFLPLHFWLPKAYASATASVAALFAIMTKVGLYAILRFSTLVFGAQAAQSQGLGLDAFWVLGLLTLLVGAIGAFSALRLNTLIAYLVLLSVGTILAGFAMASVEVIAATLFYLIHSTLVSAGLFLLAGLIISQRGEKADLLQRGPLMDNARTLGLMFFVGAISIAGLPPFSGFVGKILLLSATPFKQALWLWPVLLVGGLLAVIALSRAGSQLFWRSNVAAVKVQQVDRVAQLVALLALSASLVLVVCADPMTEYFTLTAQQLVEGNYRVVLEGVTP